VLIANNGSGKTQMGSAMLAAIVGKPALSITAGGVGPTVVELTMEDRETIESATLMVVENSQDGSDISKYPDG
jgi:Fe-S cluster assembly ATPase SufC